MSLVMVDGISIYHEGWPRNTIGSKTPEFIISTLNDRSGMRNVTFIEDRAFGRSKSPDLLDRNQHITENTGGINHTVTY